MPDIKRISGLQVDKMDQHTQFMQRALALAKQAEQEGEVPVGAVLVLNDQIIGEGFNQPIATNDPTAHAEVMAIRNAGLTQQNYRFPDADLYVTLEPCMMCAGAIIHSRIRHVYYAAPEPRTGAAGSCFNLLPSDKRSNHFTDCTGGLLAEPSIELIKFFFKSRRK